MPKPGSRLRALNILSLMLRDPRFGSKVLDKCEYAAMLESHGEVINKYGELWECHIENQEDLEERVEELIWVATLMYGVGSWDGNEAEYRADFFTYVHSRRGRFYFQHLIVKQCTYCDVRLVHTFDLRIPVMSIANEVASGALSDKHYLVACPRTPGFCSQRVHFSTTFAVAERAMHQCLEKMVETSSDWFQTIVLAEDPLSPFWAAFIQSQLRNGHEKVVKW